MRAILGGTLAALVVCFGASADDKKDEKIDVKKLVGKWASKDKKADRSVLEVTKDGKATTTSGKDFRCDGVYKVDGDKLALTWKYLGEEHIVTRTIVKLTEAELVLKDEKGQEDVLVRVTAIDAKRLVGLWELKWMMGDLNGKTLTEFGKDGRMEATNVISGIEGAKVEGTYKVSGSKLTMALKIEGKEVAFTRTVTTLTDTELIATDENGKEFTYRRVKDK